MGGGGFPLKLRIRANVLAKCQLTFTYVEPVDSEMGQVFLCRLLAISRSLKDHGRADEQSFDDQFCIPSFHLSCYFLIFVIEDKASLTTERLQFIYVGFLPRRIRPVVFFIGIAAVDIRLVLAPNIQGCLFSTVARLLLVGNVFAHLVVHGKQSDNCG